MGLDSVELLMEMEQWFGIQVSNAEAEKIATLQQMTDCVAIHLGVTGTSMALKEAVSGRLQTALTTIAARQAWSPDLFIFKVYPPTDKDFWKGMERELGLKIPGTDVPEQPSRPVLLRWLYAPVVPSYDPATITMDQFLDALCSANYRTLTAKGQLHSVYDIYIAVAGITAEKMGIDHYELGPEKSFTDDLGVD